MITGGAGGIGIAAARRFIEAGAKVLLVDLDEAALVDASNQVGSNASAYCVADVSQKRIPNVMFSKQLTSLAESIFCSPMPGLKAR